MKHILSYQFLLLLLTTVQLHAQNIDTNWVRQYDETSLYFNTNISKFDGDKYLVQYGDNYFEINADGDSLKGGIFPTATYGTTGPKISKVYNHDIYVGGFDATGTYLARLDSNYVSQWHTNIDAASFGEGVSAIYFDSSRIYVCGSYNSSKPFIAKLDMSGNIVWKHDYSQTTFSNLSHITKLIDGSYLASGNLDDYPLAFKFNSSGDTSWSYYEPIFISFTKATGVQKPDSNIAVFARNKIIELDLITGNRVDSVQSLYDYNDVLVQHDTLFVFGTYRNQFTSSTETYAYVEAMNWNYDSLNAWKKNWQADPFVQNNFWSVVETDNGGFIAAGRCRDSMNTSANNWNVLVARFNDMVFPNSIYDQTKKNQLKIYPNPVVNFFTLNSDKLPILELISTDGRPVATLSPKNNYYNISHIRPGIYLLYDNTQGTILGKINLIE